MDPTERFIPADEFASQMGAGLDPGPDALLNSLTQIRQLRAQPLLSSDPFSQLGVSLQGAAAGYRGQPNPAVEQALAVRAQQSQNIGQEAQLLRQIQAMQMQNLQLEETRRS